MVVIKLNRHSNLCLGQAMWHCETPEAHVITNTVRTNSCKESLRLYWHCCLCWGLRSLFFQVWCHGGSKIYPQTLSGEQVNFHYCRFCRPTNNFTQETEWLILFIISASLPNPPNSIPNNCEAVSPIPRNSPMEQHYWSTNTTEPCAFFSDRMKKKNNRLPSLQSLHEAKKQKGVGKYSVTSEWGTGTRVTCLSRFHKGNILDECS